MADITDFQSAVATVSELAEDPGNEIKLQLYALYKQATEGDVSGKRPGFTNFVGRAKYDAWSELAGTSSEDAEAQYIELVTELAEAEG